MQLAKCVLTGREVKWGKEPAKTTNPQFSFGEHGDDHDLGDSEGGVGEYDHHDDKSSDLAI